MTYDPSTPYYRHSVPQRNEELFPEFPHGGAVAQAHDRERRHVGHHGQVDGELKPGSGREDDHHAPAATTRKDLRV